jgi:hypothetical protein
VEGGEVFCGGGLGDGRLGKVGVGVRDAHGLGRPRGCFG